jgi:hypothetical protein
MTARPVRLGRSRTAATPRRTFDAPAALAFAAEGELDGRAVAVRALVLRVVREDVEPDDGRVVDPRRADWRSEARWDGPLIRCDPPADDEWSGAQPWKRGKALRPA